MPNPRDATAPVLPSNRLRAHARDLLQHLDDRGARFVLWDKEANHQIELSEELFEVLRRALIDLSQNRAIQVLPLTMELTTVQAAEFLQVSRPHLIKLIDQGELECRMVGTHRRIKLQDLIDYRGKVTADSKAAREELTKMAEGLRWGY
ncbi:MAG: helix-turn-helix domain-containing protein [Alphaproteobacteria bacterium]|nr:helix-turn-helix domain-containing protein [Alphaproteobacteria bacterium]